MRKTATLGLLVLLAVLVVPTASAANVTLYFNPQYSNASYCNTTVVDVMLDIPAGLTVSYGQFGIDYTPTCGDIVNSPRNASFNTDMMTGVDLSWSHWNSSYLQGNCWDDDTDWVGFSFWIPKNGPTQALIGNFTIHGNSTSYCISDLNFSCKQGCTQGCIDIRDVSDNPVPFNVSNGTFECGTPLGPSADLVVNRIDSKYIFADLNNSLMANVTNQGLAASGPFDVRVNVTNSSALLYTNTVSCGSLNAGESTSARGHDAWPLGWWTPTTVENITITVTVDCNNAVTEGAGESNNVLSEFRNTTNNCTADDMLPDTCYGCRGDSPMTTVYDGAGNVIYSVGDFKYKNNTVNFDIGASGDENQVDGLTADIPASATIKNATLYVYYCYRKSVSGPNPGADPRPDYEMSIDGGSTLTTNEYYTFIKGFTTSEYQYGTLVYDVTANVTGNGTYQAVRSNYTAGKGYASGMALMIIYEDAGSEYRIAHGYDRLSTNYWKSADGYWHYYVSPEDATTTATLTDVDPDATAEANLFTVTVDAVPPGSESEQLNTRAWDVGAWDCVVGVPTCNYHYPIGINRGAVDQSDLTGSGTDEVVKFQERASNGFGALFACLTTREKKSVPTANGKGNANFSADKGHIADLTALNESDTGCPTDAYMFPYELFKFNITGLANGETVNVIIELPGPDTVTGYQKVNTATCAWTPISLISGIGTTVITVQLTDGGAGDADGVADGQITDPGGPSNPTSFIDVDKLVWNGTGWAASTNGVIGGTYRYMVEVTNIGTNPGPDNIRDFIVTDTLPAGLSYADTAVLTDHHGVSRSIESPDTLDVNPDDTTSIRWAINNWTAPDEYLQPGQSFVIEYNATVTNCGNHRNDVNVSGQVNPTHYGYGYAWINVTQPDLNVSKITVNPALPRLCDMAFGPTNHAGARTQRNNISALIVNNGAAVTSPYSFDVTFVVMNTSTGAVVASGTEPNLVIAANDVMTVYAHNCSWYPFAHEDYTINVTVDPANAVTETDENNNTLLRDLTAHIHGLKGDSWQAEDMNISTLQCHEEGHINMVYSSGDSWKMQTSDVFNVSGVCTANWTVGHTGDLDVPSDGTTIKKARLYVYYNWDTSPDWNVTDYFTLDFNGYTLPPDAIYSDAKHPDRTPSICANCSGSYTMCTWNQPYGMVAYDVRHKFIATGDNTAELTLDPYAWQNDYTGITGMVLMVVYEHEDEPERIIWINEGFDILQAHNSYGTTSEEATTYAPFAICGAPIPENMQKATLVTITNHAANTPADDRNRLYFNGQLLGSGVWYPYMSGSMGSTEIGDAVTDIPVGLLDPTNNTAAFQSHITPTKSGDYFEACNAILIVEKGGVNVHVPCVEVTPTTTANVPIILGDITLYGAGTINLEYDPSVVEVVDVTSGVDSTVLAWNRLSLNTISISAENTDGVNGSIVFANVEFEPVCSNYGCSNLTLTVDTLVDTAYQDLPYYITNCKICIVENAPPVVSCPTASPDTILNDNGRGRAPGTNRTTLSVVVQDDTNVASVTIDLSPIRGTGYETESMVYDIATDTWGIETNATLDAGVDQTHDLVVNATDDFGNSNSGKTIELTVLRRGDAYRNNKVDMGDALRIARYTVSLDTEPNPLVSDVVQAEVNAGVNMGDALYIARYTVGLETMAP